MTEPSSSNIVEEDPPQTSVSSIGMVTRQKAKSSAAKLPSQGTVAKTPISSAVSTGGSATPKSTKLQSNEETLPQKRKISKISDTDDKKKLRKASSSGAGDEIKGSNTDVKAFFHEKLDFLKKENIRDKQGESPSSPHYNPRTLDVPDSFKKKLTPVMRQWWDIKAERFDCVLFRKVGKFYELYHMDAVIGVKELGLVFMEGDRAFSRFPETAFYGYGKCLAEKGYNIAVYNSKMMEERCKKNEMSMDQGLASMSPIGKLQSTSQEENELDAIERVRIYEEDEKLARRLQDQFDAENASQLLVRNAASANNTPALPIEHSATRAIPVDVRQMMISRNEINRPTNEDQFDAENASQLLVRNAASANNTPALPIEHSATRAIPVDVRQMMISRNEINRPTNEALNRKTSSALRTAEICLLPTKKYPKGAFSKPELKKECQVCLNDFRSGESLRILPCFHEFHRHCIDAWLKISRACPICRIDVSFNY